MAAVELRGGHDWSGGVRRHVMMMMMMMMMMMESLTIKMMDIKTEDNMQTC